MMFRCPWCGKESNYHQETCYDTVKGGRYLSETSTVESIDEEYIDCVCPECGGKFTLEPQLRVETLYVWAYDDEDEAWGEDYYDYGSLRRDYYERENRPKTKTFSLSGFSLAPKSGFSLAPPGGFSLKSRRRRR